MEPDPSHSRFLRELRTRVPLDLKTDATLAEFDTDRATKKLAACTVRRYVSLRGGRRRDVMMQLFAPHRAEQLPPGQRLGLIP